MHVNFISPLPHTILHPNPPSQHITLNSTPALQHLNPISLSHIRMIIKIVTDNTSLSRVHRMYFK